MAADGPIAGAAPARAGMRRVGLTEEAMCKNKMTGGWSDPTPGCQKEFALGDSVETRRPEWKWQRLNLFRSATTVGMPSPKTSASFFTCSWISWMVAWKFGWLQTKKEVFLREAIFLWYFKHIRWHLKWILEKEWRLCAAVGHTQEILCIFCVQKRDIVRDCGSCAEYLTASSWSRSKQPQVWCSIGTHTNAGTWKERFLEVSASLEAKTYLILFSPLTHECQPMKICWMERPARLEWWEKC